MPGQAPAPRRPPRPPREEILAARRARRLRFHLFAASLAWAAVIGIGLALTRPPDPLASVVRHAWMLLPAVIAGVAAGRRAWPHYLAAMFIGCAPGAMFPTLFTVVAVSGATLVVGFFLHVTRCIDTGRPWTDPLPREADEPRGGGGVAAGANGARDTKTPTIANTAPTGGELRKRWW